MQGRTGKSMKILLVALNSKYIHSNLAVYSLKAYADAVLGSNMGASGYLYGSGDRASEITAIEIDEYTINQPLGRIMADIYRKAPDVLFLSCYIWNRSEIMQLAEDLGKVMPDTDIWLGGPEVSYDAEETLNELPLIKGIIRGEGEKPFTEIVRAYITENTTGIRVEVSLRNISDLTFREASGEIISTPQSRRMDFDSVPFPYKNLDEFDNRIIYYESSRGCPFRCSYCLSSVDKSLKFRSPELVKSELKGFLDSGIPQVKFIDRTFNCDHRHAGEIWRFIRDNDNGITNFHFEVAADLMNDEELELLGSMRAGQVQLEIGVQSTNIRTLTEINRPMDFGKVCETVTKLKAGNNIHLHLDLIAGLPFEDMRSFRKSFNDVFSLRPHQLQLGFLKVLKGSPMESGREKYGLRYTEASPYEILQTRWISYEELIVLKSVEEMVDVYYNSGQYVNTVELLLDVFDDAFGFFEALALWYQKKGLEMINLSRNSRYELLLEFGSEYASGTEAAAVIAADEVAEGTGDIGSGGFDREELLQALVFDYYSRDNVKNRPEFLGEETAENEYTKEFYRQEASEHSILRSPECIDADVRLLRRLTHIEKLGGKYYLFDYTQRNPMTNNVNVIDVSHLFSLFS